jgi:hypothetical protein
MTRLAQIHFLLCWGKKREGGEWHDEGSADGRDIPEEIF